MLINLFEHSDVVIDIQKENTWICFAVWFCENEKKVLGGRDFFKNANYFTKQLSFSSTLSMSLLKIWRFVLDEKFQQNTSNFI